MLRPLPIVGGAYKDDTAPYSQQDCVNYIPEASEAEGTRSPSILRGAPGMRLYADVGDGPIRGARNVEGQLFIVSGNELFRVFGDGTVDGPLGVIAGEGRCSLTHNQRDGGYQVVVVNGVEGYVYNTATSTFTQITDTDFTSNGSIVTDYLNSFVLHVGNQRQVWFHSDLADALNYISTDFYEAETSPDRIVTLIVNQAEVIIFGERTIEFWVNTGNQGATFERATSTVAEQGCAGRFTPVRLDNSVFWLGDDGIVYRLDGYTPQRVSTHAVEQEIRDRDWANAFGMAYSDRGHKIYYLSFPDGLTWGFDVATGLWHRRQSQNLSRWRANTLTFWNSKWIAGDYNSGRLFELDWAYFKEGDAPLVATRKTGYLQAHQNRLFLAELEVVMNTGEGFDFTQFPEQEQLLLPQLIDTQSDQLLITQAMQAWIASTQTPQPTVWMRYSDDFGRTWKNWKARGLGLQGDYRKQIAWRRMGSFRNRIFEFQVASPVRRDIVEASLQLRAEQ